MLLARCPTTLTLRHALRAPSSGPRRCREHRSEGVQETERSFFACSPMQTTVSSTSSRSSESRSNAGSPTARRAIAQAALTPPRSRDPPGGSCSLLGVMRPLDVALDAVSGTAFLLARKPPRPRVPTLRVRRLRSEPSSTRAPPIVPEARRRARAPPRAAPAAVAPRDPA